MSQGVAVVTGANRGMGRCIAGILASAGWPVVMACRDLARSRDAFMEIKAGSGNGRIELLELDLASFRSIRAFAETVRGRGFEISALVNNAGVLSMRPQRTSDGFELTMGVNYLGPVLLTRLLLPAMRGEEAQIVSTSSLMYRLGRVDAGLFSPHDGSYDGFRAYADSKLALLLFSLELARRLRAGGIRVNSVDPGIVSTGMIRLGKWFDPITDAVYRPLIKTEMHGAEMTAALVKGGIGDGVTGGYFVDGKERRLPKRISGHPYGKALWTLTESVLGLS